MYRYKMTKNQCLIKAFTTTMVLILMGLLCIPLLFDAGRSGRGVVIFCLLAMAAAAGINWYQWLIYDKK